MTLWQRKWERRDTSTVPAIVAATLKEIDSGMYLNITECFKIFSTLPVTTCKCERNVSALRQLKTYLQSTMSQTRLTGLALLHIHYNMDIDFDEIIRRFARLHPRRMQLANILSDWLQKPSLQCRRFLWARNLLAKVPCWNFRKRGGDGASQRKRGRGGERKEKTPARKHCENEKHPLIRRAWPLFRKWVADNNKTTKQSLQSKEKQAGVYHCFYLDWVTMQFSTADEASL